MAKITTLHINNFKFFGESEPIDIGGKHLLIHGENGSGKSSIYWALYTLLECARKSDANIKKYFNKNHDRSLVNINADLISPDDWNSFISITLDNTNEYKVSIKDLNINNNELALESSQASDFLTYRFAYKIHDFRHGQDIEIFSLFFKEIFPYWKTRNALVVQKDTGTPRKDIRNLSIAWTYLSRGLTTYYDSKRRVRYNSDWAKDYKKLASDFDREVLNMIGDIVTFGNQVLDRLDYSDIKFTLDYTPITFNNFGDAQQPKIKLRIVEFMGQDNPFKFPQSFLNEARLTAIGLAIRLGFVESRLSTAELRLLILDDLLISLDMSNRQTVLDLILDKYAFQSRDEYAEDSEKINENSKKFQTIILTHDAQFNHFVKAQVKLRGKEFANDWKFINMYEHINDGVKSAAILDSSSHLEKARQYFFSKHPDYEAAGNYLRKEAEDFTKAFLPKRQQLGKDFSLLDLSGRIHKCIDYAKTNELEVAPFEALNQHRKFIFNVLSHDAYDVPRFRSEIRKCFDTFDKFLYKIDYKEVLKSEEKLIIELNDSSNLWKAVITIYEPLILIKEPGKESVLANTFSNYHIYKDEKIHKKDISSVLNIKKLYEDWYTTSDKSKSYNFWEEVIIINSGSKLKTLRIF